MHTIQLFSTGGSTGLIIDAGAGVDSIVFTGAVTSSLGTIQISNLGDSKVGASDTLDLTGMAEISTGSFSFAAGTALDLEPAAALSGIFGNIPAVDGATGFTTAVGQSWLGDQRNNVLLGTSQRNCCNCSLLRGHHHPQRAWQLPQTQPLVSSSLHCWNH